MVTRAESIAVFLVSFLAIAILAAYVADTFRLALHPYAIPAISFAAATWLCSSFDSRARALAQSGSVDSDGRRMLAQDGSVDPRGLRSDLIMFLTIVIGMLTWLLWLAWPHLLPIGEGSDLTHHLLLVDYIDRTRHLVHDSAQAPFLGEMVDYTPGMHVLAVLVGSWMHRDGLHAVYPMIAFSVALKVGVIFLIALRCQPWHSPHRLPLALFAVLLLFVPRAYFLGSFMHDSYLAQVVSELFAVTMWLAVICWDQQPSLGLAAVFAVAGLATFLTWPVWTGPTIVTLIAVVLLHRERSLSDRLKQIVLAAVPIVLIGAVYVFGRIGGASAMAGTAGAVLTPSPATLGWLFLPIGIAGAVVAAMDSRARTVPILLGAIGLQAAVLAFVARTAAAPYLALKMVYLAVYPLGVAGACASSVLLLRVTERLRAARAFHACGWLLPIALLIPVGRSFLATPRATPVISDALNDAGRWAREHVPPACVDYLMSDDDSAYWLHLVVLGNPRASARSLNSDSFDPQKALVRWVLPGGLPYAITDRFEALPKDIRENVDVLVRFGSAAVVKRRGASPSLAQCPLRP